MAGKLSEIDACGAVGEREKIFILADNEALAGQHMSLMRSSRAASTATSQSKSQGTLPK
jgi:hypothetical protein